MSEKEKKEEGLLDRLSGKQEKGPLLPERRGEKSEKNSGGGEDTGLIEASTRGPYSKKGGKGATKGEGKQKGVVAAELILSSPH